MFRLGQKVYIVNDTFEQNLPVGDYGYVIAYDRNPDNAFDYVIRIPKIGRHMGVPAADIQLKHVIIQQEAERIEKEALIDFALATKNEALFYSIMNGSSDEKVAAEKDEKMTTDDFIKQVNLKAWI